eukprot:2286011-Rhodomonas_salina.2
MAPMLGLCLRLFLAHSARADEAALDHDRRAGEDQLCLSLERKVVRVVRAGGVLVRVHASYIH